MDTYDDFTIWCARLGVISERQAAKCCARRRGATSGARGGRSADQGGARRAALPDLRALADGKRPRAGLLERCATRSGRAPRCPADADPAGSGPRPSAMEWTFSALPSELTDPLRPIVHAAVGLLTDGPLDRLKTCGTAAGCSSTRAATTAVAGAHGRMRRPDEARPLRGAAPQAPRCRRGVVTLSWRGYSASPAARSGGKSEAGPAPRPGTSVIGSGRPRKRQAPRPLRPTLLQRVRSAERTAPDRTIWPPWAAKQMRAAAWTEMPT